MPAEAGLADQLELVPQGGVLTHGKVPVECQELIAPFVVSDEVEEAEVGGFVGVVSRQGGSGKEGLEAVVVAIGEPDDVPADEAEFRAG